jgi:hypothetical protein
MKCQISCEKKHISLCCHENALLLFNVLDPATLLPSSPFFIPFFLFENFIGELHKAQE